MLNRGLRVLVLTLVGAVLSTATVAQPRTSKFDFGPGPVGDGLRRVLPETIYSDAAGFGFEPGVSVKAVDRGGDDPVTGDFCTANEPFFFSVAVPQEGNYRVTVTLGDYLLMQFGHNDQKEKGEGVGPFTSYKANIKKHITMVRARGGIPVIVSPVERRAFNAAGTVRPSLAEYDEASRQAAQEEGTAFIDLNAMSRRFYETLGSEKSALAFAAPGGRQDSTHHNNYGAYELAKCIVQGIRDNKLAIAKEIVGDFKGFDPAHPDPLEVFVLPASSTRSNQRPLGN